MTRRARVVRSGVPATPTNSTCDSTNCCFSYCIHHLHMHCFSISLIVYAGLTIERMMTFGHLDYKRWMNGLYPIYLVFIIIYCVSRKAYRAMYLPCIMCTSVCVTYTTLISHNTNFSCCYYIICTAILTWNFPRVAIHALSVSGATDRILVYVHWFFGNVFFAEHMSRVFFTNATTSLCCAKYHIL